MQEIYQATRLDIDYNGVSKPSGIRNSDNMVAVIAVFWVSLSVLLFCYIGYGLLIAGINFLKKSFRRPPAAAATGHWPPVAIVIAAYNEGALLQQKLENTLAIDYPAGLLKIIVVTDGSTDGSECLANAYPAVLFLHQPERMGKLAAIRRAMKEVSAPITVFSDANTMLNGECIKRIVGHYRWAAIGGVAGEKKIVTKDNPSAVGQAEGLYWRYESLLKKLDAGFYTVVGAAGELFSIRTELFKAPGDTIILDDFILSMQVCLQGYRIGYEPGAFATEYPSASLQEEAKRKIRIAAGVCQAIGYLGGCLNVFKYPLLSFQYISRRLLRWIFCPLLLVSLLVANIIIVSDSQPALLYQSFLYAQLLFYAFAALGGVLMRREKKAGFLAVPFYFLFMNYCMVKGFTRFLTGTQSVLWEKSERQKRKS